MKQNKFTIITPSYNNVEWVEFNLASVLNQTYNNYRVIYIDDASTDGTYDKVISIVGDLPNWKVVRNKTNKGAAYNYAEYIKALFPDDDEILVHLDGDDWLYDENVLENLNKFYNKKDCWMTYGDFVCYDGVGAATKSFPQGTPYPDFIHKYKLYRRDVWRASHLRTYKYFLWKAIDKDDMTSRIDGEYFWHASDLAWAYPALEMCPKEKIGVVDFLTCVYNTTPKNQERTKEREAVDNSKFEDEIRNKKLYREGIGKGKLPQINMYYDYMELMTIPKKFSYCYKQEEGEYDMVFVGDMEIPKYIAGEIKVKPGVPVVARLLEHKHYFQNKLFNLIVQHYDKFDVVFTHDKQLLETIPNARFMPAADVIMFNRLPNPVGLPPFKPASFESFEMPDDVFQIYKKNKLVSVIASDKAFLPGHVARLTFLNGVKDKIDVFGTCQKALFGKEFRDSSTGKFDSLKEYAFSIAIENLSHEVDDYYFSEKIVDCFLTGTIPIYYGCPNIGKFFDTRGILIFKTQEELNNIIDSLSMDLYKSMLEFVQINFEAALKMNPTNDLMYDNYLKNIIEK